MKTEELVAGKKYAYKTHKTEGVMVFTEIEYGSNGQAWAVGTDKVTGKRRLVYPSQLTKAR